MLILLAILLFLSVPVILIFPKCTDYAELHFCCFRRSTDFIQSDCTFYVHFLWNIYHSFFGELTF